MKSTLRKIFNPILSWFEDQDGPYAYKPSHRLILKIVGALFFFLSAVSLAACIYTAQMGAVVPVIVFFAIGLVCMIVGFLGSDKAVAKIWNSRT